MRHFLPERKELLLSLLADLIGAFLLGISVDVFAIYADFAPGGVTGLAVICHYLFSLPVGLGTLLINIPVILFTWKRLGPRFFAMSLKTMILCALVVDHVTIFLPSFSGSRGAASVLAGIAAGIGYAFIFDKDSCTGGTDFIIFALKHAHPRLSYGLIAFLIDGTIVVLSVFVFRDVLSFVYGMIYSLFASLSMDAVTRLIAFARLKS
ncbi:MAG: YitT family protein [Clostridia bacterium]|nr:YitT family protein [Clostridia bacterium]